MNGGAVILSKAKNTSVDGMAHAGIVLSKSGKEMYPTKYSIIRIGVFGSAARDDLREESDIDVVVELAEPDLFKLIGIKQDMEEQLRRPVDIVRYRNNM